MNNPCLLAIFLGGALYFGLPLLAVLPVLVRLLKALASGAVKWPGPVIRDPNPGVNRGRLHLGWPAEHLFSTFIVNTLGLVGAFSFSLLSLLSATPLLSDYVYINWSWGLSILVLAALAGGAISVKGTVHHMAQVNVLLSDLAGKAEPRQVDGQSAEAEYAIEHPLVKYQALGSDRLKALGLFYEGVRCYQDGDRRRALPLYQEALNIDSSLHQHAREALANMAQGCSPTDAGPIYYWLGAHSEYLMDLAQAAAWYEKAILAFGQLGYPKREARAHCNLGNVKMRMRDPSAMEEFEKAIALNPRNGTAYINIGTMYYGISERGDPRFERALDAFANAIVADPLLYGPIVIARLREIGYTWKEDLEDITKRVESKRRSAAGQAPDLPHPAISVVGNAPAQRKSERSMKKNDTLAFSLISYSLIAILAFLYIHFKVGIRVLLSLTNTSHQPLSDSEFNIVLFILMLGIGASVCLMFLLGVAANSQGLNNASIFFDFVARTMEVHDKRRETLGGAIFSDYMRRPCGVADALRLQVATLIHALVKILTLPFSVVLLNRVVMSVFAILLILPIFMKDHPLPVVWTAGYVFALFYFCYRATLLQTATRKGVARAADVMGAFRCAASPSLDSPIQSALTHGVTPDFIAKILDQESVIDRTKNDLMKTGQIGYRETWRLGLITPDQDRYDPRPSQLPRQERIRKLTEDNNYRLNLVEQIPLKRTAVLFSTSYFDVQLNSLVVAGGSVPPWIRLFPGWSYSLSTKLNRGEFIPIRNIQIDTHSASAQNRSQFLPQFLREDGFPLKGSYGDGDPLTTERGGTIVIDKDKLIIIYPRYFVQRRLIDDAGDLVDIGLDENFNHDPMFGVKMRPSVSELLIRYIEANGYIPVLRYRSVPYASDFMLPILDTPMSMSGWAELFIDTRGKAKLFIAKEKALAEWYEMMNRLRQLFYDELARKDYHLLGLTKDKAHLNYYLSQKQEILKDYYIIQDWNLSWQQRVFKNGF
jgi:tetratricopeptide (TPR) repeat protein